METKSSLRRRVTILGTAAVVAGLGATVLAAGAADAATTTYQVTASPTLNERSGPSVADALVGTLNHGASVTISCQTTGSVVDGSNIWDKLTTGAYVSDYWLNTPVFNGYSPGLARCSTTPPPPPPVKTGRTTTGNEGAAGQCTWWAIQEFHAYSGLWPYLIDPADNGNAQYWATNAAYDGWTVTATPRVDSIVVFPAGVNGADSVGHVAWVTNVSNGQITFTEMNGPAGPYNVDTRTVTPASSVRYILAP